MQTPKRTLLYPEHEKLGAKMTEFAGWVMPVQYPTGIFAEHRAVRTGAGLFDVSHMGVFEVVGADACDFLEAVLASDVESLEPGQAQYSCMLGYDGHALDDLYVFCIEPTRYMLVVNAANTLRDWDWLNDCLTSGAVEHMDDLDGDLDLELRNLRDAGPDSKVILALQGPSARQVLRHHIPEADLATLDNLKFNEHAGTTLCGHPARISRTGYTGERICYELYVHPDNMVYTWRKLLAAGEDLGVLPAGLGARDSLRVEAGLPLFGHELEGPCKLTLTEIGYGFVVRDQPSFIGKAGYDKRLEQHRRRLLRLSGRGRKTVRAGHAIVDEQDRVVGEVTSFAFVDEDHNFVALACADRSFKPEVGVTVRGVRKKPDQLDGPPSERDVVELAVMRRHPDKAERQGWHRRYARRSEST